MSLPRILVVLGTVAAGVGLFLAAFIHGVPLRTDIALASGGAFGIGLGALV